MWQGIVSRSQSLPPGRPRQARAPRSLLKRQTPLSARVGAAGARENGGGSGSFKGGGPALTSGPLRKDRSADWLAFFWSSVSSQASEGALVAGTGSSCPVTRTGSIPPWLVSDASNNAHATMTTSPIWGSRNKNFSIFRRWPDSFDAPCGGPHPLRTGTRFSDGDPATITRIRDAPR